MPVFRSQQEIDEYVRYCVSGGKIKDITTTNNKRNNGSYNFS